MSSTEVSVYDIDNGSDVKRNKTEDIFGNKYDRRSGTYGEYDKAIEEYTVTLNTWLTPERCATELMIINAGKEGPPFEYPPCLIMFILMLKEEMNYAYRRVTATCIVLLSALNLKAPSYKTVQRNKSIFFGETKVGYHVMKTADMYQSQREAPFVIDPTMFVGSGVLPDYSAPQKIPTCQKDVEEQKMKDEAAEEARKSMEVFVCKDYIGKTVDTSIDGSGIGTKGTGIYMEFMWQVNSRSFIKQHVAIDVHTQKVVAASITFESPGDAKMLCPLIEGMKLVGVKIGAVYADSAYDTKDNWEEFIDTDIDFTPNLKKKFKDDAEIPERRVQRELEEKLGKKLFHRISGYNIRWLVESFFSVIKRLFGERVRDRQFRNMSISMRIRYTLYNIRRDFILRYLDPEGKLDKCAEVRSHRSGQREL